MRLYRLVLILLGTAIIQSCMLSGKMTKIVSEHYVKKGSFTQADNTDWLIVNSNNLQRVQGYCKTRYNRFFTIPLIVYTYSDEKMECHVNPRIYVNSLIKEINTLTQSEINSAKIKGKQIELTVNSLPSKFNHHYNNHFIALDFLFRSMTLSFTKNELYTKGSGIEINYIIRVKETLEVIKTGTLNSFVAADYYQKNYGQRRKFFVQDYLYSFDNKLENACRQIAQDLINQL